MAELLYYFLSHSKYLRKLIFYISLKNVYVKFISIIKKIKKVCDKRV